MRANLRESDGDRVPGDTAPLSSSCGGPSFCPKQALMVTGNLGNK